MENQFKVLGLSEAIVSAVEEMGFVTPTEVQQKAIPHILKREDLIVMSKTGSGKTGAFSLPILEQIEAHHKEPRALILAPTRELAVQVDSDIKLMSKHKKVSTTVLYGQHNMNVEIAALKKGAVIVTGTPGRVFDHIRQKTLATQHIEYLVLDEADRMLDMGFIDQVVRIIKTLPKQRVTLLFSATMPTEIKHICREYMKQPVTIEIESETKTVDTIEQCYYRVEPNEKRTQLERLLITENPESCMVFCNTRAAVDKVNAMLWKKGYATQALHGANTQSSRMRTIDQFKKGDFKILVATDVAARGIHIEDLSLVINYDVPQDKDSYVHRIGRTGRAGKGGRAITMVTKDEIMSLYEIEEHVGVLIEEAELPTDEYVRECEAKQPKRVPPPAPPARNHQPKGQGQKSEGGKRPASSKARPAKETPVKETPAERKPRQADGRPAHSDKRPSAAGEKRPEHQERRPQSSRNHQQRPPQERRPDGSPHHRPRTERPAHQPASAATPAQQPAPAASVAAQTAANPAAAPKPSFFKRVLDLFKGKS